MEVMEVTDSVAELHWRRSANALCVDEIPIGHHGSIDPAARCSRGYGTPEAIETNPFTSTGHFANQPRPPLPQYRALVLVHRRRERRRCPS